MKGYLKVKIFKNAALYCCSLAAVLMASNITYARGNVVGATIINIDTRADGLFLVTFSQSSSTPAGCANVLNRMSGNANTAGGKAVLATALTGYSAGSRVALAQGTDTCNEYGGIESIVILSLGS
jgi:hypothetical protein